MPKAKAVRPLVEKMITLAKADTLHTRCRRNRGRRHSGGGGVLILPWPGYEPRWPWIQNIYVKRGFRRRGIAREITGVLLDWCRAQGFHSVLLHASDEGRPLYEQLGFFPTNEMRLNLDWSGVSSVQTVDR